MTNLNLVTGDNTRCGAPRMSENRSAIWQIADRFTKSVYKGANGHIGNSLVRALVARGKKTRASVRNITNRDPVAGLACELIDTDLMGKGSLRKAMAGATS